MSAPIKQEFLIFREKTFHDDSKKKGQNKARRFGKTRDHFDLCPKVANGSSECEFGDNCRFLHNVHAYLQSKPPDISDTCPIFSESGECKYGFKCRFLGAHMRVDASESPPVLTLLKDPHKIAKTALSSREINFISSDILKLLRSKKYPFPISDGYLGIPKQSDDTAIVIEEPEQQLDSYLDRHVRFAEKKRLHWEGKTYLAPLTTVGNLPFRRLCVDLGADITCGEMALSPPLLSGSKEEWSLLRRHPSESIFGVQLAGNRPSVLVPAAEVIAREFGSAGVDFVDVNCGCPIDLVFKSGSGSALLDTPSKLGKILVGMNKALGDIPLTVKLRTGVKEGKNTAHKLMPRLGAAEWGVGAVSLHGRTRQQRYTRLADWDYIRQCVEAVRAVEEEHDLPPLPIFGNGDLFSPSVFPSLLSTSGVTGLMIGRGALIKPWIFSEIKEGQEKDISPKERLELVSKLARYGLSHFGSDTAGVNTTRRYVCEALSFQYRYVPIGLLERLPARINDRAPAFRGRNELETLLASPDSKDWVKISEMFLGPAPDMWSFTPKHKSNAYDKGDGDDNMVGQG